MRRFDTSTTATVRICHIQLLYRPCLWLSIHVRRTTTSAAQHSRFMGIVFYVQNKSKGDESKENSDSPVGSNCDCVTVALATPDIGLRLIAEH